MRLKSRIIGNRGGQSLVIGLGAIFIFSLIIAELLHFRIDHKLFNTTRKLATRLGVERSIRYGISCATTTLPANLPAADCDGVKTVNIRRWEPYTRVNAILPQPGGTGFYVGGDFTRYNGTGGVNRLVRLQADGTLDAAFNTGPGFNGAVRAIADAGVANQIYVGGEFTQYQGVAANYLVRLNPDGSRDVTFNNGGAGEVLRVAGVPGGVITSTFDPLLPLIPVGTVFPIPAPPAPTGSQVYRLGNTGVVVDGPLSVNGAVLAILPLGSGDIVFGGAFTNFGGTSANRIVLRGSSLAPANNYWPGADRPVFALAESTEVPGQFFAGGAFTTYQGIGVAPVIRLQADGTRLGAFPFPGGAGIAHYHHPSLPYPSSVYSLFAFSPGPGDHRLYVGGNFAPGLYRYDLPSLPVNPIRDVTLDAPSPNYPVHAVVARPGVASLIGGEFLTAALATVNRLVALTQVGTVDGLFNSGAGFDDQIMIGANGTPMGYPPVFQIEATCTQAGGITTFNLSSPDPDDAAKRIVFFKSRPLTCPD